MRGFGIFLGILAGCIGAAVLAGFLIWPHVKDLENPITGEIERTTADAKAFAGEHEQLDCAPEAFHRLDGCSGFWCLVGLPSFTRECLARAAVSPGLCDEVPESMVQAVLWPTKACLEIEADPDICRRILTEVVKVCTQAPRH